MALNTKFNAKNGISVGVPSVSIIDNVGNAIFPTVSAGQYLGLQPSLSGLAALVGGNSLGSALTIGTNDSFNLNLETGGSNRLVIDSAGASVSTTCLLQVGSGGVNTDGELRARVLRISADTGNSTAKIYSTSAFSRDIIHHAFEHKFGSYQNEFVRFTSDQKVGIGTTAPNEKLTVVGGVSATGGFFGPGITVSSFPTAGLLLTYGGSSAGASYVDFFTSGSHSGQAAARLRSSNFSGGAGFLLGRSGFFGWNEQTYAGQEDTGTGIVRDSFGVIAQRNSTSPQELRIYKSYTDASNYERFIINTNAGATGATQIGLSAAGTGQNRNLEIVTGGSTRMTILSGGNVGIGTAAPTERLNIVGNVKTEGNLSVYNLNTATTLDRLTVDGSQGRLFTVTDALTGSLLSVNDISGLPILEVFDDDRVIMGEYASNALAVVGKNVGIGTASPSQKLTVVGVISSTNVIYASGGNSNLWNSSYSSVTAISANSSNYILDGGNTKGANLLVGTNDGYALNLETAGTTKMSITSAGFVGIGVTAPSSILDINDSTVSQKSVVLSLRNGSFGWWTMTSSNSNTAGFLRFASNNSGQTPLTLDGATGCVGISNNAPTSRLDIADTTLAGSGGLQGSALSVTQTWATSGNPTLIYGRVTNTSSGASSNLIDLGTVAGGTLFKVTKTGNISFGQSASFTQGFEPSSNTSFNIRCYGTTIGGFATTDQPQGLHLNNSSSVVWTNAAGGIGSFASVDLYLNRRGPANLRLGAVDAAAPVAQTLSVQSVVSGTTNTGGTNLTITGSQGTGTGAGGSIIFQTAPAGSSGTVQNGLSAALTIDSSLNTYSASNFIVPNVGAKGFWVTGSPTHSGMVNGGGLATLDFKCNAETVLSLVNNGSQRRTQLHVSGELGFSSDLTLIRDAANTLAMRNGINPQTFRLYNTYSNSTTFERADVKWDSTALKIGTDKGTSGGAATPIHFYTDSISRMIISSTGLVTVRDEAGTQQQVINNYSYINNSFTDGGPPAAPWLLDASTNDILHNYATRLNVTNTGTVAASGVFTRLIEWPASELTDVNGMTYTDGYVIVRCYSGGNAQSVRVRVWNNSSGVWSSYFTAIDVSKNASWGLWRANVGGNYMTKLEVETTSPPGNSTSIQSIEYYPIRLNYGIRYPHKFAAQGADKLLFGGGKSTHAAIVGSGNTLKIRNGNDSADGSITAAAATFSTTLSVAGISTFSTIRTSIVDLIRSDANLMPGALAVDSTGGQFVSLGNCGNSNGTNIYGNSTQGVGLYVGSTVDLLKPTVLGRQNGTTSTTDLSIYNTANSQTKVGIRLGNSSTAASSNIAINFVDYTNADYGQIRGVYNGAVQTGQLAFLTANGGALTETLRITNTGNVGIGTITPNEKLTVVGAISSTNVVYASGGNSNLWNSAYTSTTANNATITSTYTTVNSNSANWSSVYTTTNANSAKWDSTHLTTNALSSTWQSGYTTTNANSANWNSVYSSYNTASATIHNGTVTSTSQGNVTIPKLGGVNESITLTNLGTTGSPTFANLTVSGSLSVVGDFTYLNTSVSVTSALSVVNTGTGPALLVRQSGTTPIAHFIDADGTGDIIFENNGFVGLGVASPTQRLTVAGAVSSTGVVYASGGNSDLWNSVYTTTNSNSANYILAGGNSKGADLLIGTNDNFALNFETNGTTKMSVTNAGNVGIGVTAPRARIHVNGGDDNSVFSNATIALGYSSTGDYPHFIHTRHNNGTNVANAIDLYTSNGTAAGVFPTHAVHGLTVTNGSVGIGTTAPSSKLHVEGNSTPTITIKNTITTGYSQILFGNSAETSSGFWLNGSAQTGYGGANSLNAYVNSGILALHTASVTNAFTLLQNGNIGIGTTTPNEKLTVVGNISSSNVVYASGGNSNLWNSAYTAVTAISANSANYILDGGNTKGANLLVGTNDNFNLNLETGGTTKMTITSAGFVGIGIAAPTASLDIPGSGDTSLGHITLGKTNYGGNIKFRRGSDGASAAYIGYGVTDGGPGFTLNSGGGSGAITLLAAGGPVNVYSANTNPYIFAANGSFGVGTITPVAKLDILDTTLAGSGALSGSALSIAQTWNTTGNPTSITLNVTNSASGTTSNLLDLQVGGSSRFKVDKNGATTMSSALLVEGGQSALTSSYLQLANSAGRINFNSNIIHMQSATGLGWIDLPLWRDAANTLAQRNGVNPQAFRLYSTYTDASNYERFFISTNVGVTSATQIGLSAAGTGQNRNLEFVAGGSTRMTVTSAGNVGIGTTSTQALLDVNGDTRAGGFLYIDRTSGNLTSYFQLKARGAAEVSNYGNPVGNGAAEFGAVGMSGLIVGTQNSTPLVLGTANAERVRITSTGNVGIGTTGPNYKLEVVGNGFFGDSTTAGSALTVSTGAGSVNKNGLSIINSPSASYTALSLQTNWSDGNGGNIVNIFNSTGTKFLINNNGNVGIGTATPTSDKLHVVGSVKVVTGALNLDSGYPIQWGGSASGIYSGSGTSDMVVTVGSTERLRINGSSGNVGIGPVPLASPIEKLTVAGNISASNIVYATGGNSNLWNSTYTSVSPNSANWSSTYTTVTAVSAIGASTYSTVNASSANWTSAYNTVNTNSSKWDNTYTTTNANSANWSSSYTTVTAVSAIGASTYTTVNANSANWNSAYTTVNANNTNWTSVYTTTLANSANWSSVYTTTGANSANWSSVYTTTGANSANWNSAYNTVNTNSSKWNSAYSTTNANSANWSSSYTTVTAVSAIGASTYTTVNANSANWNSAYTIVNTNNTNWTSVYTTTLANSANWNSVYSTTNANSANWNSAYSTLNTNSSKWDSTYSTTNANSANWSSSYTTVTAVSAIGASTYSTTNANSANWNSVYTTTGTNSANWNSVYTTTGTNSARWNSVYTTVNTASANYILDGGNTKGANLLVGTNDGFALNFETNGTTKMSVTSAGNVGIGTTTPTSKLEIVDTTSAISLSGAALNIAHTWNAPGIDVTAIKLNVSSSASGANSKLIDLQIGGTSYFNVDKTGATTMASAVFVNGGNSNQWNSNYTTTNTNSAKWNSDYTTVNTSSASWSSVYSTVNAASANYIVNGGNTTGGTITIGTNDANNFNLESNGTARISMSATGQVGVGTLTPDVDFVVYKNVIGSPTTFKIRTATGTGSRQDFYRTDGYVATRFDVLSTNEFQFYNNNDVATPKYIINGTNGNFGIGTTSTAQKVTIGGSLSASGTLYGDCAVLGDPTASVSLERDAANTLGIRATTAAQTLNVYGTYTSGTNFERLTLAASALGGVIGHYAGGGGGVARDLIFQTSNTTRMTIAAAGSVNVAGHFSAATKSFLIDHPTQEGKKLQYGVVESNQHSVLVRGRTSESIIELPEEWLGLVHEDSVTVQLTPLGSYQQLYVVSQDNQRVVVGGSTGKYNYTIYGERKDVDKLQTVV